MMLYSYQSIAHIKNGIMGAFRLTKLDFKGFEYFGNSKRHFWFSFVGAILIAPLFLTYLATLYMNTNIENGLSNYLIVQSLSYSIAWLTFPLVMLHLGPFLKCEGQLIQYLVACNWVSVIQNGVYLPIIILGIMKVIPEPMLSVFGLTALLWILGVSLFVTYKALNLPLTTAAGIVVLDLLLGVFIEALASRSS